MLQFVGRVAASMSFSLITFCFCAWVIYYMIGQSEWIVAAAVVLPAASSAIEGAKVAQRAIRDRRSAM